MSFFLRIDAWELGLIFFCLMLLSWMVGISTRKRFKSSDLDESSRIEDASIALFALLLAFCFSGASTRYENRKEFLRDEAIAIGDFAATASMLEKNESEKIRKELVFYVEKRLLFGKIRFSDPRMADVTNQSRASQNRIAQILRNIIHDKKSPTLHTPLMNGFNGVTMTHDKAFYGSQNQVADTIILLLISFGMVSSFIMGRLSHDKSIKFLGLLRFAVYVTLVSAVFTVTMDLEQPHRGIMLTNKAPLIDLLNSLK